MEIIHRGLDPIDKGVPSGIPVHPINYQFARFGARYYLKIDVEGFDPRIIDAIARLPYRRRFIPAERACMVDSLNAMGAAAFKLVNQKGDPPIIRLTRWVKSLAFATRQFDVHAKSNSKNGTQANDPTHRKAWCP
jgi:hypothetical protein